MADFDREMVRRALEERARSGEGGGYELPEQTAYEAVLPDLVRQQAQAEDQQRLLESYQVQPAPVHEAAPLAVPRNTAISPLLNLQDPGPAQAPSPPPMSFAPPVAEQPQVQTEQPPPQRRPVARSSARRDMEAAQQRVVGSFDTRAQHVDEALAAREELGERQQAAYREMGTEAMLARERMDMMTEAHQESVNRAQKEQRELASQIGSYEPTDRRTTGQRVAGAIAMAMSGLADAVAVGGGNAPTGYLNRAMEMIDRSIERDLQQQREMIANKQTQLAAKNTELGQMMARYGDSVTAEKAAYAMRLEPYLREIDALQARGVTDEARQVGSALKDEYRFKQDAMMQEIAAAKYQQEMAARGPTIEQEIKRRKQLADLEFRELEVAGKRQELAAGPQDEKLSGDERKVQRSLGAVKPAVQRLSAFIGGNIPYVGVRSGTQFIPEMLTPDENLKYRRDVMAVAGQALRDDSGAVLGPSELSDKLERMGVFGGSHELRQQGLKDLLYEYSSRLQRGQISPAQEAALRGKSGASR